MKNIIFLFLLMATSAQALVLEEIPKHQLETIFKNKKIGYFIGSFDPPHRGHQAVVETVLNKHLVEYLIMAPVWGRDQYKNRSNISIRLQMLKAAFKEHPKIIISSLPPEEMQALLTRPHPTRCINGKPTVQPVFNTEFIGIVGSDVALKYGSVSMDPEKEKDNQKTLSIFLRGIEVTEQYKKTSIGSIMAIPVESFIVSMRKGDDILKLKNKISDRPIVAVINPNVEDISSSKIKKWLKENKPIQEWVDPAILNIIHKESLYTQSISSCDKASATASSAAYKLVCEQMSSPITQLQLERRRVYS